MKLQGVVIGVAADSTHRFSKRRLTAITLIAGIGVEGDAHAGPTVQHRSRVRVDPTQPNLRQVHLLHGELFNELAAAGFSIGASDIGENITTSDVELLRLPRGSRIQFPSGATVIVTGLRNPCTQLNAFAPGLMDALLGRGQNGELIRKAGIMGTVAEGGVVQTGDRFEVVLPPEPHHPLERV